MWLESVQSVLCVFPTTVIGQMTYSPVKADDVQYNFDWGPLLLYVTWKKRDLEISGNIFLPYETLEWAWYVGNEYWKMGRVQILLIADSNP